MLRVLTAAAVALVLSNAAAQSEDLKYHAVWQTDSPVMHFTGPLEMADFSARAARHAAAGRRLVDVETTAIGNARVYLGLWTEATAHAGTDTPAADRLLGPMAPAALQRALAAKSAEGLRLTDIEVVDAAGQAPRLLGVLQPGTGAQVVQTGLTPERLHARDKSFRQQGLYLADLEARIVRGRPRYTALWRTGKAVQVITTPRDLPGFQRLTYAMDSRGFYLADLVAIRHDGRVVLGGVWALRPRAAVVSRNDTTESFIARGGHEAAARRGLADLELTTGPYGQFPDIVIGGRMGALSVRHY